MMADLIFVLSDQNGDLVGHMSFQENKIICSPAGSSSSASLSVDAQGHNILFTCLPGYCVCSALRTGLELLHDSPQMSHIQTCAAN